MIFPKLHIELERWKFNKEYQVYVSTFGNVMTKDKKPMKQGARSGYMFVKICGNGISTHRLVLMTWKPIPNANEMTVDHLDHNKRNNKLSNLEWVTQEENMRRAAEDNGEEFQRKIQFVITNYTLEHFYLLVNDIKFTNLAEAYQYFQTTSPTAASVHEKQIHQVYTKLLNGYNNKSPMSIANNFTKTYCNCKFSIVMKGA